MTDLRPFPLQFALDINPSSSLLSSSQPCLSSLSSSSSSPNSPFSFPSSPLSPPSVSDPIRCSIGDLKRVFGPEDDLETLVSSYSLRFFYSFILIILIFFNKYNFLNRLIQQTRRWKKKKTNPLIVHQLGKIYVQIVNQLLHLNGVVVLMDLCIFFFTFFFFSFLFLFFSKKTIFALIRLCNACGLRYYKQKKRQQENNTTWRFYLRKIVYDL